MKFKRKLLASSVVASLAVANYAFANSTALSAPSSDFTAPKPQIKSLTNHGHDHDNDTHDLKAPTAETVKKPAIQKQRLSKASPRQAKAIVACDVNALTTNNTNTLVNEIKQQGADCVNDLFGASASTQQSAFNSNKMIAVANNAQSLAAAYAGGGSPDLEALFLYLRAGFYVEFLQ